MGLTKVEIGIMGYIGKMERKGGKLRLEGFRGLFRREYEGSLGIWVKKNEKMKTY